MYIKDTWRDADSLTNVWLLGDSIAGYWSYQDRFEGWFFQLIKHYKERGFNIKGHDASINGGYLYSSVGADYTKPAYVTGARPGRIAGYTIDTAIADGATDVILAMTNNDVFSGYTEPNPAGLNNIADEKRDLYAYYQSKCDANNITLHILTENTNTSDQSLVDDFKFITDTLVALDQHNFIDNFYTLADPDNNYLAKAGYYLNAVHPNDVGNDAVFDTVLAHTDEFYSLTQEVYTLTEDKPCGNNTLLLDDNNIALQDDLGAFLFGD